LLRSSDAKFLVLILIGVAAQAQPQPPAPPQSFAVAAIKESHSGERTMLFDPRRGGAFTAANCSLGLLIQYAYDVMQFQISGAPGWVQSDRYDISAKAEGDSQVSEIRGMLQRLLEDRFQLKYHWETKEAAAYHLVVSKAGKLRESGPGDCPPSADGPCGTLRNSPGNTKGYKLTSGELAGSLSFFVGRPVLDKTGLTGKYDIELQWTPERVQLQSPAPSEESSPSIFTALQEQLGLKLESAKGPMKTLVIDHVERPSEN
jgi:uncharacterized protein (TIGR03435 family)